MHKQKPDKRGMESMADSNDRLSQLLKAWPDIEPGDDFADGVWRRVYASQPHVVDGSLPSSAFFLHPFRAAAAAAAVGVLLGAWAAWISISAEPGPQAMGSRTSFRTLSQSYTDVISGG